MNCYVECKKCQHQWMLTGGNFNITGCPACGAAGTGRMSMGSNPPDWYKGAAAKKAGKEA